VIHGVRNWPRSRTCPAAMNPGTWQVGSPGAGQRELAARRGTQIQRLGHVGWAPPGSARPWTGT
jgi:hypothetical protein